MSVMQESTVQRYALEFLRRRYRWFAWGGKIFAEPEVRTKPEYGGKRADGLVAYHHWIFGTTVVSMEAKSRKTMPAIRPYPDRLQRWRNSLWAGLLISVVAGGGSALYRMDEPLFRYGMPLLFFVLGTLLYFFLTAKHYGHYQLTVVAQVGFYPGNRRWLAVSADSLDHLRKQDKAKILQQICRSHGIGLLEVYPGGRVCVRTGARRTWWPGRIYLRRYLRYPEIQAYI